MYRANLYVIHPTDVIQMFGAIIAGDTIGPDALRVMQAIDQWEGFAEKQEGGRPLCMTCDHKLPARQKPDAFAVLLIFDAKEKESGPGKAILGGFCPACVRHSDLSTRALAVYKRNWPDLELKNFVEGPARDQ